MASNNAIDSSTFPALLLSKGGTNANLTASNGGIFYSTASAGAILSGTATANQILVSGSSTTPSWFSRITDNGAAATLFLGATAGNSGGGGNNTAMGYNALMNTASMFNAAFGDSALAACVGGGVNSAFGSSAGAKVVSGGDNSFFGGSAGGNTGTSIANCSGFGANALNNNTGNGNTAVGSSAGNARTSYTNCTFLGQSADAGVNSLTNATAIGSNATVSVSNALVLGSGANVGIGTSSPNASAILDLTSTTGSLLVPRMTTTQKNALTGAAGMIVYDTTLGSFYGYNGAWVVLTPVPGQNMVINGDMQVWQRGAGGSAAIAVNASTTAYTADRWQLSTGANEACTVTQAAGATSGAFLAQVQRNNGQTGTAILRFCTSLTRDMCIGAAGNIVTLSFKAKSGANFSPTSSNITVTVYSGTGTSDISGINGAFTGSASAISQTQALTTTLTNYSFSSSALGATVTQLAVQFSWTPTGTAGVDDSAYFTDVQLEISNVQTPFDRNPFTITLDKCKYFYQKSFNYATAPAQNAGTNTGEYRWRSWTSAATATGSPSIIFGPMMRASPSITVYNPAATNAQVRDETAAADCSATATAAATQNTFVVNCTGNVSTVINGILAIHWSADIDIT